VPKTPPVKRFEELLDRLEDLVKTLEGEELDLERSIRAFEEGVALARECHQRLDEAERRVEVLRRRPDGTLASEPLAAGGEEGE
jgi:exodeoxyribonuclease VII small subunit